MSKLSEDDIRYYLHNIIFSHYSEPLGRVTRFRAVFKIRLGIEVRQYVQKEFNHDSVYMCHFSKGYIFKALENYAGAFSYAQALFDTTYNFTVNLLQESDPALHYTGFDSNGHFSPIPLFKSKSECYISPLYIHTYRM